MTVHIEELTFDLTEEVGDEVELTPASKPNWTKVLLCSTIYICNIIESLLCQCVEEQTLMLLLEEFKEYIRINLCAVTERIFGETD